MNPNLTKTEEKIRLVTGTCKIANDIYLLYLRKYVNNLITTDTERDIQTKKAELGLQMGVKKLLKKNVSKEIKQYHELNKPKLYAIPFDLNSINRIIKERLAKRGWK